MSHSSTPNGCYYCRQVRAPCRHPLNRPTPRTWPPPQYMPVRSLPEFPRSDPDNESERQTTDIQSSRPTRGPSLPNINRLQPTLERSYGFIFEHDDDNTMPPRRSRPQVRPQVEARPEGVQNATLSVAVNDYEFPLTRGNHVAGIGALSSFPRATSRLSGVSIQRELPFIADTQERKVYTRFCPICLETGVGLRAVYTACGHCSCYRCARKCTIDIPLISIDKPGGGILCPICRISTNVIQLFED